MAAKKKKPSLMQAPECKPEVLSVYYQTSKQVAPHCHRHFGVEVALNGATVRDALVKAVALVHGQLGIQNEVLRPRTVLGIESVDGRYELSDEDMEFDDERFQPF